MVRMAIRSRCVRTVGITPLRTPESTYIRLPEALVVAIMHKIPS